MAKAIAGDAQLLLSMRQVRSRTVLLVLGVLLLLGSAAALATWYLTLPKPAQLTWDQPNVRRSIMSFAYKVYGNPNVAQGRYFLSKLILTNRGGRPVRSLSVSYQVPDYISWTTPETVSDLPASHSAVALFYPKFPESIAHLDNVTNATLETKLRWQEDGGVSREEIVRSDFAILGRNEVQYGDLAADEMLTWYDSWTLGQFIICMVTPNDPVVKEYAAAITKKIGGTLAGVTNDPKTVLELMKAAYDYMRETGMVYVSDEGVPMNVGDVKTLVQTVRLPRDVITTNSGLCIELAILWASLLTHLGCDSYIVLRPGHAFTLVQAGDQMLPIECTAITPKAVGAEEAVPFETAVKMAAEDYQKQQYKIVYSVHAYKADGYASPELPAIDSDKISRLLAERERPAKPEQAVAQNPAPSPPPANAEGKTESNEADSPANAPPPAQPPPSDQNGMARYEHPDGLVSFSYPQAWQVTKSPPGLGVIFQASDPRTNSGLEVLEVPGVNSVPAAFRQLTRAFAKVGSQLHLDDTRQRGDVSVLAGHTVRSGGISKWLAFFHPVNGGVVGVAVGCPAAVFADKHAELAQLLQGVQFQ